MDADKLKSFGNFQVLRNIRSNAEAKHLVEALIEGELQGAEVEDFEYTNCGWERSTNVFNVFGILKKKEGAYRLEFDKGFKCVGFQANQFNQFNPDPELIEMLKAIISNIEGKARSFEESFAQKYTEELRYGTEEYLAIEFNTFARCEIQEISEGKPKTMWDVYPIDIDIPSKQIIQWLRSHKANMDNIHVTKD